MPGPLAQAGADLDADSLARRIQSLELLTSSGANTTGGTIGDAVLVGMDSGITPTKLIRALAKVRAGTADCRILLGGDSTTWGTGANPGITSPAPLIAARLATLTGLPVYSNFICPASPSASVQDSRVTLGSGWALGGNYGFGSNASWQASNGAAGNLTVTYNSFADKVRIYYLQNSGLGTFTPTVNTVAKTAQSAVGAAVIGVYEATFTRSNANTLVLAPSVNTLFILGIEWFDTTQKCVYIAGAGVPSATSGDWAQSAPWKALPMIAAYAPDHSQINLGINDTAGAVAAAAYQANMAAIATQAAATGSVDLQTFYSADTTLNRLPLETAYLAALRSLVASGGYGLVDTRAALGEYATANGFGFMADQVHPNALGYAVSSRWQTRRLALAAN